MLGPIIDRDGRAGHALAALRPARAGVGLIVRKPLAVPANRARLTRAGLLLVAQNAVSPQPTETDRDTCPAEGTHPHTLSILSPGDTVT